MVKTSDIVEIGLIRFDVECSQRKSKKDIIVIEIAFEKLN